MVDFKSDLVNMGTEKEPVMVPRAVVNGDGSANEQEWWEMLANGSVNVPFKILDELLLRSRNDPTT